MFHMTFFCFFPCNLTFIHTNTHMHKRAQALKHTQIQRTHIHLARDILKYRCQAVQFICFVVELSCWYMKAEATIVKPFNILYVLTKAYAELMGFIFCPEPAIASYIWAILYAFACVRKVHMDNGEFMGIFFMVFSSRLFFRCGFVVK